MNLRYTFLFLLFFCFGLVLAQSPYNFTIARELGLSGAGAGLLTTNIFIGRGMEPLTAENVEQLRAEQIPGIDRWATRNYSREAQKISDGFLYVSTALPLALLAGERSRRDFEEVGLLTLEAFLLNMGVTNLTKTLVGRPRPLVYNPGVPLSEKLTREARFSYFSGHTSTSAAMSFMTARIFNDFYPDSGWKPVVWSFAVAIPAITAWNRIRAGKHFLTDVLTGYAVGALVGILIPELHN